MANPSGLYPRFKALFVDNIVCVPNSAEGALNTIPPGVTAVQLAANANGVSDFTVLPPIASVPVGHRIIICAGAANSELRTPAASTETINNVNADGTQEALLTANNVYTVTKKTNASASNWVLFGHTNLGAAQAAIVPDA